MGLGGPRCRVAIIECEREREDYAARSHLRAHVRVHEGSAGPGLPSPDLSYRIRGPYLRKSKRAERTTPVGQAQ